MSDSAPIELDEKLLHATIKLNTVLFAAVCGLMAGVSLLLITYISLNRGLPDPGHYLNLLGFFMPGYNVSVKGAWIGLLWGGVIGALAGAVTYRIYARGIRQQVLDYFAHNKSEHDLEYVVLRLHGHSLGLAIGGMVAIGLIATTNWLVLLGIADESVHAALLAQYLPGYSVSFVGSLVGALEVLIVAYLFCILLAAIYNLVHQVRRGDAS